MTNFLKLNDKNMELLMKVKQIFVATIINTGAIVTILEVKFEL